MVLMAGTDWLACSPDGIALIYPEKLGLYGDDYLELASVEVKTVVTQTVLIA